MLGGHPTRRSRRRQNRRRRSLARCAGFTGAGQWRGCGTAHRERNLEWGSASSWCRVGRVDERSTEAWEFVRWPSWRPGRAHWRGRTARPDFELCAGRLVPLHVTGDVWSHTGMGTWEGLERRELRLEGFLAGPSQAAGHRQGPRGLFPLPVTFPGFSSLEAAWEAASADPKWAVESWLAVAVTAINWLYGCKGNVTPRAPGKVHQRALNTLRDKIERFLAGEQPCVSKFGDVVGELKQRKVNYTGEEIALPYAVSVDQIVRGLPPVGHGGSVPLVPLLSGRTRFLVENPLENVLETTKWGDVNLQAKVHVQKGEELAIWKLLEERGIIRWVPESTALSTHKGPLLNGLFGVVKPGKLSPKLQPVLRVIMNLVPANSILSVIEGDIGCLPHASSWIPLVISEGEELFMSQSDMSCAFYLFALPECWAPCMTFNFATLGETIGREPGKRFRPSCMVLPMGWNSSVGLMQQASREVLLAAGLPRELELRKGVALPPWFTKAVAEATVERGWWQVYLDNFLSGESVGGAYTELNLKLQNLAMLGWTRAGILTAEDKQVLSSREVVELGIRIDGNRGLLGASPERTLKTLWCTVHLLMSDHWSKKLGQLVLGRWVFILQFRRAAMAVLSRAWEAVEATWPKPPQVARFRKEVLALCCLAPLLQTDLLSEYDSAVTCSDASESGGAAAVATGLTWSGRSLKTYWQDVQLRPLQVPLLLISVFNGIGGCFRIYDVLGLAPHGRISIDISAAANRVTRSTWPDVLELHNIDAITKDQVREWANRFNRVQEVHVMAGFPCVHLSSVRAGRRNLDGEGSNLFWALLTLLGWIHEIFGSFCKVKHCIENVASMDDAARKEISSTLDIVPIKLDPADCMPYNRPRLAWCTEELYAMEELELHTEGDYVRAVVKVDTVIDERSWMRPGWSWPGGEQGAKFPTFMKAIKRLRPPPVPAGLRRAGPDTIQRWEQDSFRLPPYQYGPQYLLHHRDKEPRTLDSSERELLLGFGAGHTASCMAASRMKQSLTEYEDVRRSLCGDSFAVISFAIMAAQMSSELAPRMKPSQILRRLGLAPGASAHPLVEAPLTRWLSYGGSGLQAPDEMEVFSRQLGLLVNHTGSDVRVQTGATMGHKTPSHGSVRAWWWQWKQLFTVRWAHNSHINYLEMRMILNTLLWKARDPRKVNKRWIHVEDSMVCLYILTKGRTSSRMLQPLANKIGALQLGLGVMLLHGHVTSAENPTDKGSRQWWESRCQGCCWRPAHKESAGVAVRASASATIASLKKN